MVVLHLIILLDLVHLKMEEVQHKPLNRVFLEVVVLVLQVVLLVQQVIYILVVVAELELLEELEVMREQINQVWVVQEKI